MTDFSLRKNIQATASLTGVLLLLALAGELAAQHEPFTLIVLPDTQHYSDEELWQSMPIGPYPEVFDAQTTWIREQRDQGLRNIVYVLHEGDFVNDQGGRLPTAMARARQSMAILDSAAPPIPYAIAIGNHDYSDRETRNTERFDTHFPVSDYTDSGYFRGVRDRPGQPPSLENSYHLFTAGGTRWMILCLEFGPSHDALDWANEIVAQHPDRRVLVLTHTQTYWDDLLHGTLPPCSPPCPPGTGHSSLPTQYEPPFFDPHDARTTIPGATDVWTEFVSQHPNISFVLSGHVTISNDNPDGGGPRGAGRAKENATDMQGVSGNTIYQLLANAQQWYSERVPPANYPKRDTGFLRIMTFDPAAGTVDVDTYSPNHDEYVRNEDNDFTITGADLGPLALPTADSVSMWPGSSSRVGHDVEFVASYSSTNPGGWRDLEFVQLLVGPALTTSGTAFVLYSVTSEAIRLYDESTSSWSPAISIDSPGTLSNDIVTVDADESFVRTSGETLRLTLNLRFKKPLSQHPSLDIFARAMDDRNQWSTWERLAGNWAVEAAEGAPVAPEVGSLTSDPDPGGFSYPEQDVDFIASYSDANGWGDIASAQLLVGQQLSGLNACYLRYLPGQNKVQLRDDADQSWQFVGSPGTGQILQNSRCWVDLSKTAVKQIGDTLQVNWRVGFTTLFATQSPLKQYLRAWETPELDSGWVEMSNWTLNEPLAVDAVPLIGTVVTFPADGASYSNLEATFESTYSDANGWEDLGQVLLQIKETVETGADAVRLRYLFEFDVIQLRNDDGTAWMTGGSPGSPGVTLENNQVRVNVEKTSVETVGCRARVVWNLEFKDAYINSLDVPSYEIWHQAIDLNGQPSGWVDVGSWKVEP